MLILRRVAQVTNELDQEIAAYDVIRADLESRRIGEWVVIHGAALVDVFPHL